MRGRYLKNIGRVRLFVARRADDAGEGVAERARRRRGVLGDRVVELVDRATSGRADEAGGEPDGDEPDREEEE